MKKLGRLLLIGFLVFGLVINGFCAWDATKPADNEKLKDTPAKIRANWDAIATGTDSALQVTNEKVSATADILDTKLHEIGTANKINATAFKNLSGTPSGAGVFPAANIPNINGAKLEGLGNIIAGAGIIPIANIPDTVVKTSGDQTVAGIKTFSSIPVLPASDPTSDNQASRKAYVDGKISKTTAGEIAAMTEKTTPTDNDLFLIEDSEASNAKKKVKKSSISSTKSQLFTSSGTFTAPTGVTMVWVTLQGGGGGGGSGGGAGPHAGCGGGGGGYLSKIAYEVVPANNYTVTVGTGGAGGVYISSGGAGNSSSFDGAISVAGGSGGGVGNNGGGGAGALAATTNNMNASGTTGGGKGIYTNLQGGNGGSSSSYTGGGGGGSNFGVGPNGSNSVAYNGIKGSGGTGGPGDTGTGGNGGAGLVLVEW